MSSNENSPTRDLPKPGWQVVREEPVARAPRGSENDKTEKYLVKLGQMHIARVTDPTGKLQKFVETDYVHVSTTHKTVTDKQGSFTFNETAITPSDEEGADLLGYLYYAHRVLSLEEALFAVGEI